MSLAVDESTVGSFVKRAVLYHSNGRKHVPRPFCIRDIFLNVVTNVNEFHSMEVET